MRAFAESLCSLRTQQSREKEQVEYLIINDRLQFYPLVG